MFASKLNFKLSSIFGMVLLSVCLFNYQVIADQVNTKIPTKCEEKLQAIYKTCEIIANYTIDPNQQVPQSTILHPIDIFFITNNKTESKQYVMEEKYRKEPDVLKKHTKALFDIVKLIDKSSHHFNATSSSDEIRTKLNSTVLVDPWINATLHFSSIAIGQNATTYIGLHGLYGYHDAKNVSNSSSAYVFNTHSIHKCDKVDLAKIMPNENTANDANFPIVTLFTQSHPSSLDRNHIVELSCQDHETHDSGHKSASHSLNVMSALNVVLILAAAAIILPTLSNRQHV